MKAYMRYGKIEITFSSYKKFCDWAERNWFFYIKAGFSRIRANTSQISFLQKDWLPIQIRKTEFKSNNNP